MAPCTSCWSVLLLGTWFLFVVAGSQNHMESFTDDYTPILSGVHSSISSLDYIATLEDDSKESVHQIPSPSDSIRALTEDYSSDSNSALIEDYPSDSNSGLIEDYANAVQLTSSPKHRDEVSIDDMPPWPKVHPSTLDSVITVEKHHPANRAREPTAAMSKKNSAETSLDGSPSDQNLIHPASVYLHASQHSAGDLIPRVSARCLCSNNTVTPTFFITPNSGYQIVGAGNTSWTCHFSWSATDLIIFNQDFIVYAPPANFNDWTVDTKGFNLFEFGHYVHIYDWVRKT